MKRKPKYRQFTPAPLPKRGRQPHQRTNAPTPQTVAKLQHDLLRRLTLAEVITDAEATAGRSILDAWELITGELNSGRGEGGYSMYDSPHAVRLQEIWRVWAAEMLARTFVRPFVIVEWIQGDRQWDKGAGRAMAAALDWWIKAARQFNRYAYDPIDRIDIEMKMRLT